jgi:deoxyribodipyrimidine photo-lyase
MTSICLLHDEMLNPEPALLQQHAALPRVFVFDMGSDAYGRWSLKRLQFMADCLVEIPELQVYRGHLTQVLVQLQVGEVYTQATPACQLSTIVQKPSTTNLLRRAAPTAHISKPGSQSRSPGREPKRARSRACLALLW